MQRLKFSQVVVAQSQHLEILCTFKRVIFNNFHVISVHNQVFKADKIDEQKFGNFIDFKVENVKHICQVVSNDCYIRVVFDEYSGDFTNMIL